MEIYFIYVTVILFSQVTRLASLTLVVHQDSRIILKYYCTFKRDDFSIRKTISDKNRVQNLNFEFKLKN